MAEGFKWDVTPGQAFADMFKAYTNTLFASGAKIGIRRASDIQDWMRDNAPWTDITGIARESLYAVTEQDAQVLTQITVAYGYQAPHGLWLEIAYGGKWAIIPKTIDYWGPIVWQDVQRMMNLGLVTAGDS